MTGIQIRELKFASTFPNFWRQDYFRETALIIIILRLHLSVCVCVRSRRWPEAIQPKAKKSFFLGHGRYNRRPIDTASYGPSRDWSKLLQKDGGAELDSSLHLHKVAWWTQKNDFYESMLSKGACQEMILF